MSQEHTAEGHTIFSPRPLRSSDQSNSGIGKSERSEMTIPKPDGPVGRLTINLDNRTVEVDGEALALTSKEYGILEVLLRRTALGRDDAVIKTGKLSLNLNTHRVEVDGKPVHLTSKEYAILEFLSLRKGNTLTKVMLLEHLYNGLDEPEAKIIDVFICKLRKKLAKLSGGETYIETVRGRGYVLRDPADVA